MIKVQLTVLISFILIVVIVHQVQSFNPIFSGNRATKRLKFSPKKFRILDKISIGVSLSGESAMTSFSRRANSSFMTTATKDEKDKEELKANEQTVASSSSNSWEVDLLYDSECPICMMEVEFLRKRDINHKIRFTDLQSPSYNPAEHGNVKFSEGMRKIRAVLPDNTVVTGVDVFRRTYDAIGLGWVFQLTKLPVLGVIADAVYDIWAENRLRLTGRGDFADMLKEKAQLIRELESSVDCNSDACAINFDE